MARPAAREHPPDDPLEPVTFKIPRSWKRGLCRAAATSRRSLTAVLQELIEKPLQPHIQAARKSPPQCRTCGQALN